MRAQEGQLVNTVVKVYPNVSQFWTYDEKQLLHYPNLRARLSASEKSGALII